MPSEREGLLITSTANPTLKRIRALASGHPDRGGSAFFCEGFQSVGRALTAGADIEALVVAPDLLATPQAESLVAEAESRGTRIVRVSAELFGRLSERDGPSGLAAVVRPTERRVADLEIAPDAVFVVLHEIANPGNLGSILRTADAAGVAAVILTGVTAHPFSPVTAKSSMGSIFNVPIARERDIRAVVDWARGSGVHVTTTSAHAGSSYAETRFPRPLALVFGNEGSGLRDDVLALGDDRVVIPMVGSASSLNLSVAVGILLFEVQREVLTSRLGRP